MPVPDALPPSWSAALFQAFFGLALTAWGLRWTVRLAGAHPSRPPPPSLPRAGAAAICVFLVASLLVAPLLSGRLEDRVRASLLAANAATACAAGVGLLLARRASKAPPAALGLFLPGPRALLAAPVLLVALLPGFLGVSVLNGRLLEALGIEPGQGIVRALEAHGDLLSDPFVLFSIVVLAPLLEETLFRGLLQRSLRVFLRPAGAVVLQAAAFALVHDRSAALPVFVVAVGLGILFEAAGSLVPGILAHALFNAAQLGLLARLAAGGPPP